MRLLHQTRCPWSAHSQPPEPAQPQSQYKFGAAILQLYKGHARGSPESSWNQAGCGLLQPKGYKHFKDSTLAFLICHLCMFHLLLVVLGANCQPWNTPACAPHGSPCVFPKSPPAPFSWSYKWHPNVTVWVLGQHTGVSSHILHHNEAFQLLQQEGDWGSRDKPEKDVGVPIFTETRPSLPVGPAPT